jgi:hypothetical protein
MSAVARISPSLLPRQFPLRVEGGRRFIGHVIPHRDFPAEYRAAATENWDALIDLDHENVTLLDDDLSDRFLAQHEGRKGRFVQKGLEALEVGPKALHARVAIERQIRSLAGELAALEAKPDPTDSDRARIAELVRAATLLRADLINVDSVIFRHSGPGFQGRRHIEIIGRLAGAKPKERARAARKAAGPSIPNLQDREIEARLTAEAEARTPAMTAEEEEAANAVLARIRAQRKAGVDAEARAARPAAVRKTREQLLADLESAKARRAALKVTPGPDDPGVPPRPAGP